MQKKQRRQRDAMGGRVFVNKRGAGRGRAKQSEQHESAPRAPRAPSAPAAAPAPAQLTEPSEPAEPDKKTDTCSVPEPDSATMSSRVLGIDFGTTNTVVAVVMEDGVIEVLANDFWDRKTPSVVHIDPTDPSEHQVGEAALKLGLKDPQNTIRNVKRVLGFPPEAARFITALGPVRVLTSEHGECVTLKLSGDTKTTPEEVVAMILLELKKAAEHQLQETVSKAVIAVPSYFTAAQRQAVRDAAALADLEVMEIVNETTAAALAYAYDKEYSKTALIVDVGGGGCCISVVRVENNEVSVLACSTRQPGGENFDAKMVNYLKKVVVEQHKKVVVDTRSEEILRSLWVGAKAKLSRFPQTSIQTYLPEIGTEFHKPLTQAEFNSECSDLFQHITTAIHATIKRAQVEANKLDDVILVGGSTRIVKLRELIIEAVGGGVKLHKAVNPGEVVAQGAALLGAKCVQIKREVLGLHTYMTIMDSEKQEANEHWAHSTPLPVSVAFKSLSMTNCKELEMRQGYETKTLMTVCRLPIPQKAESITIDTQGTFSFLDARKNKLCGSYLRGCLPESMKAVKKRDIERKAAYKNAERAVLEGLNLKVAEFEAVTSEAFDFVEMCEGLLERLQENPCMNASDCAEVSSKVEKGLTNLRSMCLAEVDRRQRRESLLVFLETALKDGEPLRTFAQGLLTWLEQHPQADKEQLEEVRASVEDARRSLQEADKLAEATEAKRGQAALTMRRMTQRLGLQPSGAPTVQLGTTPEISPAIGIDLGTTTSMVAVYQKRTSEIIPNDAGQKTTPSYVFFTDTEEYVGEAAKEMANRNTLYDSKRLLGRRFADVQQNIEHWPFKVVNDGGVPKYEITRHGLPTMLTPEEVSAKILKAMKVTAEDSLKRSVEKAVITVPAYFNDSQRQATRSAARLAGLEVLELLNEPTAAAIAFGFDKVRDQTLLIFHLGRSTFDVTVLHICSNNYQIKAHGGDTHLGGQDFDAQLLEYVILDIRESLGIDLQRDREDDPELMHELRAECELVKRKLSTMPQSPINLFLNRYGKGYRKDIPRAFFEGLCLAQFRRAINILPEVLSEAKVTKDEIDEVVLVGGSTRIPKIRSMVQEFFDGKELSKSVNPEEAVALGAAIRAASLSGRAGAKRTE